MNYIKEKFLKIFLDKNNIPVDTDIENVCNQCGSPGQEKDCIG
jgi:hypothetical protein